MFYTYILECADKTLYTGYTNDLDKRLAEHNGQSSKAGAKYTNSRRPVILRYKEEYKTKSEAMKREAEIKKYTRVQKLALINSTQTTLSSTS